MNHLEKNVDSLVLSTRQTSLIVAGVVFIVFVAFMTGYFLGTKHATEEFIAQVNRETFADHIFASMHTMVTEQQEDLKQPEIVVTAAMPQEDSPQSELTHEAKIDIPHYFAAELIGFGTKKAALDFIDRVHKYIEAHLELRERTSTGKKGKKVTWYQVVTPQYTDRTALDTVISAITRKEKLNQIHIVCS